MNESFIHHVIRVALILGVMVGLTGFALLLYAADFWGAPAETGAGEPSAYVQPQSPALTPESDSFMTRSVYWMFGPPAEANQK